MIKVKFKKWDCIVERCQYNNGRIALELIHEKDGDSVAVATVNVPEIELPEDEVLIKDYSENSGMVLALQNAGIIGGVLEEIPLNFVTVARCKLLI